MKALPPGAETKVMTGVTRAALGRDPGRAGR